MRFRNLWRSVILSIGQVAIGGLLALAVPAAIWGVFIARSQAEPATEDDFADQLPRIAPLEPEEAIKSIEVLPGFRIEQVAAEPLVRDPVAMDFDENGRLFVVEMCDYSEQDKDFLGNIRMLEDTDGDGRFDKSTVFADKLSWPTAVLYFDGGVFVGAAPHIYYLKDSDGDGVADVRNLVFTGFSRTNVQGLLNSFRWGLDNRIHGATSHTGALVTRPGVENFSAVNLSGRDFSFDPRKLDIRPESGGSQHGMSFDDWGRKFVSSNSDHIQLVMFEDRYAARNPLVAMPPARMSIAADGPQAEVFRRSPVEPWRVLRTRMRVEGGLPGAGEGGGKPAGFFTGATAVTIYRGDAFPEEFRGMAFVGDVGSNLVHRKKLEPNGVELIARRIDKASEFVASSDIWFRPAQYGNAPDGTFYILDVYREVIEHPASLPEQIKKHLDLTSGRDRGRIYRVVPDGFKQPALPQLGKATTAELVQTLEHRNGWYRDVASRLLYERQAREAIPALQQLVRSGKLPQGRMHALYALQSFGALDEATVLVALADQHPRVRQHAVRLAEGLANESSAIRQHLFSMTDDEDQLVRYQLAYTLGEITDPERTVALAKIALRDSADYWMCRAMLTSLATGAADVLSQLVADEKYRNTSSGRDFLNRLSEIVGAQSRSEDVAKFEAALTKLGSTDPVTAAQLVRGYFVGRQRADAGAADTSQQVNEVLRQVLASAQKLAIEDDQSLANRQDAVRALGLGQFDAVADLFEVLLEGRQPQELQLVAIETLGRFDNDDVASILLSAWPGMSPRVRAAAADVLFSRPAWIKKLFSAIEDEELAASEIEPARLQQLQSHTDAEIRAQADSLAAKSGVGTRQEVIDAYQPALKMEGNAERGKVAFQKTCVACHRMQDVGHEIGPNLATFKNRGAEAIFVNVLDPNREVNPQFVNYIVQTSDGRSLSGMIAGESAASITLRRAENATDTVLRSEIEQLRSTGQSIMPEGLEKQIDQQTLADIIAYILSAQ
jgi:putative membrane-bound dehydrogenase-like protein